MSWPLVARVAASTAAEGPYTRTAVWVAGCSIRCAGCFNEHLFDPARGIATDPSELVAIAKREQVEGLTLLGGEPFDQAAALAALAEAAHNEGLGVMTFTGYTMGALTGRAAAGDTGVKSLLMHTDLLVDGPFLHSRLDLARPWVGSTNQSFRFLTPRYLGLADSLGGLPDRIEVRVTADGTVEINGWSPDTSIEALLYGLATHVRA